MDIIWGIIAVVACVATFVVANWIKPAVQRAPVTDSYNPEQRNLFFIALMGGVFLIARGIEDCREGLPGMYRSLTRLGL
jgi:hypothetical protein